MGAVGPNNGSLNFKLEMGNPEFPKLRVLLMHARVSFLKENIAVMQEFRQVYKDISVINNPEIVPSEEFLSIIQVLINAGLEDRIMFGSDKADIKKSIASVNNLNFLSIEKKYFTISYKPFSSYFNLKISWLSR